MLDDEGNLIDYKAVESISIANKAQTAYVGDKIDLTANVLPADATDKSVAFSSSDPTVAAVNAEGKVTFLSEGTVTITASSKDDASKKDSFTVTVSKKVTDVAVTSVSIQNKPTAATVGDKLTLTVKVSPDNATNKNLAFESSDKTIATVSETGVVTFLKAGSVTITVKSEADSSKSDSFTVTVSEKKEEKSGCGSSVAAASMIFAAARWRRPWHSSPKREPNKRSSMKKIISCCMAACLTLGALMLGACGGGRESGGVKNMLPIEYTPSSYDKGTADSKVVLSVPGKTVSTGDEITATVKISSKTKFEEGYESVYYIVDWGDGTWAYQGPGLQSASKQSSVAVPHTYKKAGDYKVSATAVAMQNSETNLGWTETKTIKVEGKDYEPDTMIQNVSPISSPAYDKEHGAEKIADGKPTYFKSQGVERHRRRVICGLSVR